MFLTYATPMRYRSIRHRRGEDSYVRLSRQSAIESAVLRYALGYLYSSDCRTPAGSDRRLGAMTSELKPGFHIEIFVSGGPKNYAYRIVDSLTFIRETVCKVRGITLNYSASQTVNFDVIEALVLGGDDTDTVKVHTQRKIKRKRADGKIHFVTEPEEKTYRVSFLKRRRLCGNTCVPFGYI